MVGGLLERQERILVLDSNLGDLQRTGESIARQMPTADVTSVSEFDKYKTLVSNHNFDIVVLDFDVLNDSGAELIRELKLKDYEPAVLVVSGSADPKMITELYDSGCQRCIVKEGGWVDQLGPAVRHLIRMRKLEEENRRLMARLTEANILLAEKNRRLDEFGATVAHDVRGPLAGISMKLEYLLDTYDQEIDERFKTVMERALQSSERLTDMVQAMYSFARLGTKAAEIEEVNLNELVRQVIDDMHFDEALDITFGIGELPNVWGNPELLRRVFINLIGNAVKYNDKQEIVVNIGVNREQNALLARFVEIFVSDNGPGIDQLDQKDIFTLFSRGSNAKEGTEGEGIGLSVVQRIIDLHYGSIRVESEPGKGAKFIFTLPVEEINFVKA